MKQNEYGIVKDKEYYKFKEPKTPYYMLYKGSIYKTVKRNEEKHIVMNVETNVLFSITWGLYWMLTKFKTIKEVVEQQKQFKNVFQMNQLELLGQTDFHNFEYNEQPKPIEYNRATKKHYDTLGIIGFTHLVC